MKLSIIIPVYKVEETLTRCVESIVSQDISDMEVILVDDGSPDKCPELCDTLAEKHPAIKVIHKRNGGLSSARNEGLSIATGDYITFADSDDYIDDGTYMALMEVLKKHPEYDILEYPVMVFYGSKKEYRLSFERHSYDNAAEYWLKGRAYTHTYAWNKIYRRNLFDTVRYPEGIVFEDVWTMPLLLEHARHVGTCDKGLYYYCMNKEGITSTAGGKEWKMLLDAHITALKKLPLPPGMELLRYYMHVVNIQIMTYGYTRCVEIPKIRIGREMLDYLRDDDVAIQSKIKCLIIKIFNLNTLCRLNNLFFKKRKLH